MNPKLPRSKARMRYRTQKYSARQRGIEFKLTFEEWDAWWLSHGIDRGVDRIYNGQSMVMCRVNDQGAYELSNIYCDTQSQNVKDQKPPNLGKFGAAHHLSRAVQTPHGIFGSVNEAARFYKKAPGSMWRIITSNKPGYHYL